MTTLDTPARKPWKKRHLVLAAALAVMGALVPTVWKETRRYVRSSKTAEAVEMLDLIQKGARAYYSVPRTESGPLQRVPCQYPASTGPTPAVSCCDPSVDRDGDGRCDEDAGQWGLPTWSALRFSLQEPHYFSYEFRSAGTLGAARFEALAYGDLDCDGEVTTFQVSGAGYSGATMENCDDIDSFPKIGCVDGSENE